MNHQATEALRLANHTKAARRRIKREIKQGKRTAASVIANPPDRCGRMPLIDVLMAQNMWGRYRAHRLCWKLGLYELRPIEQLTDNQRERLIDRLGKP